MNFSHEENDPFLSPKQETRLNPGKAVDALLLDHVMSAMVRVNATEGDEEPVCTSCKDQGKAEASCQDCASFLCSQCVTAHRFMRCFENHCVVSLEDLNKGQGDGTSSRVQQLMHKTPLTCAEHPSEILKVSEMQLDTVPRDSYKRSSDFSS